MKKLLNDFSLTISITIAIISVDFSVKEMFFFTKSLQRDMQKSKVNILSLLGITFLDSIQCLIARNAI